MYFKVFQAPTQELCVHISRLFGLLSLACLAPGLAQAQAPRPAAGHTRTPGDPFESLNRKGFALSLRLDKAILGPVAKVSRGLIPRPLEKVFHNMAVNLTEPVTILNDLLQLHPEGAVKSATRVVVNTTFGLAGALDLAAGAGIHHEDNGFGETLGRYGVKPGPYLFVPVIGPSDVRDLFGLVVDQFSSPIVYVRFPYRTAANVSVNFLSGLDERAEEEPKFRALLAGAADPYATLRSTYIQAREARMRGDSATPPLPDIDGPDIDSPGSGAPAAPAPATPGPTGGDAGAATPPPGASPPTSGSPPAPPPSPATPSGPEPQSPGPAPAL